MDNQPAGKEQHPLAEYYAQVAKTIFPKEEDFAMRLGYVKGQCDAHDLVYSKWFDSAEQALKSAFEFFLIGSYDDFKQLRPDLTKQILKAMESYAASQAGYSLEQVRQIADAFKQWYHDNYLDANFPLTFHWWSTETKEGKSLLEMPVGVQDEKKKI